MPPASPSASRRIRILFLINALWTTGGAERFALGLATHLPADRFEVTVCTTRLAEPRAAEALRARGIRHLNLGRKAKWDVHRFAPLVLLLRRQRFDVLHSHMFGSNLWGVLLGRAFGVPVRVAHEHNWSYSGDRLRIWLDRAVIARLATRFVAVSHANERRMVQIERIPATKIVVLPTAYIPHPAGVSTDLRAELGLKNSARIVLSVAVLRREKALDVLLDAHARVRRTEPDVHLVIAGDGPTRSELEHQASELGTADAVHILGLRFDVDALVAQADVCAMSSEWEGMPLFALEAMAACVPMVATSVGGIPEVVDDGITGLLVPPRDSVALADALAAVLASRELAARLASAAGSRREEFRIDAVAARFASLYDGLLAETNATPA